MADVKTPAAPKVQTPVPATPAPAETKKPKKERKVWTTSFSTPEAAVKEAETRTTGPRRAFKCTFNGKEYYTVSHNEGRAGGVAFSAIGGTVEELGKKARAPKTPTVDNVKSMLETMKKDDPTKAAAIEAALKALTGA